VIELEESKATRRGEILSTAARVIAAKGFASATVRDIADAAGILSGSLYHHFKSKDQMLVEILQTMLSQTRNAYEEVSEQGMNPRESVSQLLRNGFGVLERWQVEIRILQNDFPYLSTLPAFSFVSEVQDEIEQIWVKEIKRGMESGVFSSRVDAGLIYRVMMGSILNAGRWFRRGGEMTSEQFGRVHAEFFLNGLLNPAS
jgi:AcrR family transcriptional regulator